MKITDTIGNTPLIKVSGIYCKCEQFNPTGSIKDRIAYEIIKNTESNTIIEVSSGNTAVSTAFICSVLGKKAILLIPVGTSDKKVEMITRYGGLYRYCKDIEDGIRIAKKYAKQGVVDYIDQFSNPLNVLAQKKMAFETAVQLKRTNLDAIVCGIGTGGTMAALQDRFSSAKLYSYNLKLEGTSDGVPLPLLHKLSEIINYYPIKLNEVIDTKVFLAHFKGIDVGYTSAANFLIASKLRPTHKNILVIFHDAGWRYLE